MIRARWAAAGWSVSSPAWRIAPNTARFPDMRVVARDVLVDGDPR
jgi:hypothetical protein